MFHPLGFLDAKPQRASGLGRPLLLLQPGGTAPPAADLGDPCRAELPGDDGGRGVQSGARRYGHARAARHGATVWAVDVNERALELTRRNAEEWGLIRVNAVPPAGVPDPVRFGTIWSN